MKQTYVRGHYRRKPRRTSGKESSLQSKAQGYLLLVLVLVVALSLLVWLISRIPPQILLLLSIAIVAVVAVFLFLVVKLRWTNQEIITRMPQPVRVRQTVSSPRSYAQQIQDQQKQRERIAGLKTLGDLLTLTPPEFEQLVGNLLQASGYTNVEVVGKPGDLCVDLTATDTAGKRVIVQCKRFGPGRNIGSPDIQKFLGMMVAYHQVGKGIYITTSDFKQTAFDLVKKQNQEVLLVNGRQLVQWVHNASINQGSQKQGVW